MSAEKIEGPHPVDIHVGSRVRLKRTMLGLSQEALGDSLGVTFQQVQKYEKGTNRISASKLFEIAELLKIKVDFLFDGLPSTLSPADGFGEDNQTNYMADFFATPEGIQLNRSFAKIKDPKVRKKIIDLVRSLSDEDSE